MGKKGRLFVLLMWKNYVLQKRKVFTTILEIGLPTFFALILIFIRLRVVGEMKENKVWDHCDNWHQLNFNLPTKIAFSPDNEAVRRVMGNLNLSLPSVKPDRGFETEKEMVDFLMFVNATMNNTRDYIAGIVFNDDDFITSNGTKFPERITYKLRFSSYPRNAPGAKFSFNPYKGDKSWSTDFMFPLFQRVGPREDNLTCGGNPGYVREGFMALQNAVDTALMIEVGGENATETLSKINIRLRRHPYPKFNDDNFILVIQKQFPLILMLSFVLVALNIVKDIVHEKERKLKESMKMMGLNNWLHWSAWFLKYLLFMLITVLIMLLFFSIPTSRGPVTGNTSPTVTLVFLLLYAISTICFCFAVSCFFSKANSGAAAGGILFFVTYIPYFFIQPRYQTLTWAQKILTSLIFNVGMAYGGQIIGMYEGTGSGIQWSNIGKGVSVDDSFTMLHIFIMLIIDSVIYLVVAWYVEAVFPGDYGVPQKWYFPIMKSYWCGSVPDECVPEDKTIGIGQNPELFEADPIGIRPGIRIRNLKKEFKSPAGKKIAVSGMTLDMYDGQITALLGHNGAGKTTTMHMLTGFITPTSGTAYVNGFDIQKDIASVRSSLGLCPQHDILFDSLTVEEHLKFFAKLKGCPSSEVNEVVDEMLESVDLMPKKYEQAKTLSGGMKRKLSVGIALIWGSKIVILDEPSSGLDPEARRHIWTVLQKNRKGRTMVLTTHFMDEADLLGDRIAIMADGIVKCCGSSLFLKNKYGAGYHMVIVKDENCKVPKIAHLVQSYVPQAKLETNVGAELSYILPHESSDRFEELFTELENNKMDLGISSYGASVTTMEEVFLRVGEGCNGVKGRRAGSQEGTTNSTGSSPVSGASAGEATLSGLSQPASYRGTFQRATSYTHDILRNKGLVHYTQQFQAMFIKRALHTLRNKLVTVTQLAVPLIFTIAALIVIKTLPGPHDNPALNMTIDKFGDNIVVESIDRTISSQMAEDIRKIYEKQFEEHKQTRLTSVNNHTHFERDGDMIKFLLMEGRDEIGTYNLKYMIGAYFQPVNFSFIDATAYFNDQAFHSPAIAMQALVNSVLRYITNNTYSSVNVINHPLPRTEHEKVIDEMTEETTGFTVAFNIVFGMAFLASSFTLFLIKERATKAKHQQFVSGVSLFTFWLATFTWDMINFLMPAVCLLITMLAFDLKAYIVEDHLLHIALLFILYGFAMLPFMYLWSFLFTVPSTGFVWLTMFNILSGTATILAVAILSIPQLELQSLSKALEWVFLILLPNFCLGQGLEDYYSNYEFKDLYTEFCPFLKLVCKEKPNFCCADVTGNCGTYGCIYYNSNPLGWAPQGIGRMLVFLTLQGCLYFGVLFLFESQLVHTILQKITSVRQVPDFLSVSKDLPLVQEDDDVAKERARLANADLLELFSSDKLIISELSKYYGNHLAVNHISVGIPQGECFGLLGVNGAGKTTTFKMLTGDETVTSGVAFLEGHSVLTDITQVRQNLGYCPQFDALIDQLTGRETLYMYARLRGIQKTFIPEVVNDLLHALLLTEHADKLVKAYSGGNKRKLSTAIALVGNPSVVFLDEPTTGMDPVARRYLWDALCSIRESGRTLILTSHSMEECEALCTRLAVMVNGQFKCLGSPQHLKGKFGEGYTLLARVGPKDEYGIPDPQPLMNYIEEKFPCCVLKDVHQGMVNYHITDKTLHLAAIFGIMERAKATFNIEDYSVSQTTLEQVFINFARAQIPPHENESGCCKGCFSICDICCCCCNQPSYDVISADSVA